LALTPGTRLGVYEVTAQIGEGGMGQVYRATDTKLKRQVAIKILPPSLAADHDRIARFQREAEVLASLNHPNIAGIYGLEEGGGTTALVMELNEGDDPSQRIAHGATGEVGLLGSADNLQLETQTPIIVVLRWPSTLRRRSPAGDCPVAVSSTPRARLRQSHGASPTAPPR